MVVLKEMDLVVEMAASKVDLMAASLVEWKGDKKVVKLDALWAVLRGVNLWTVGMSEGM